MKIIFLGTGGSMPTKDRGLTSIAVRRGGETLLFDAGEGTQRQMTRTKVSPMKVDAIFVTHFHGDHFLGIPGLVQTMSLMDRERTLEIYGPPGTEERISSLLKIPSYTLRFEIEIRNVSPGEEIQRDGYRIETAEIDHSAPGIGYALVEDDRPGKFYPKKAKELGIEPGPQYSRLQQGESIELSDGQVVEPEQVMGPPRPGRKVVYADDTRPSEDIVDLAEDADVLIHDATFASDLEEEAREGGHSTVQAAAEIAEKADAEKLILTHFSPRYPDLSELEEQAKEVFPNSVIAEDLMEVEIELKE